MRIERPHSATIVFRESRKGSAVFVVIVSAAILAWEWLVWGGPTGVEDIGSLGQASRELPDLVFYILAGLPGVFLPLVLRRLAVAVFGRVITFDGLSRTVTKNNRILAGFDDIDRLRLRKWDDSNARLHLFLKSGKKIRVGKLCHTEESGWVQTEISNLLKKAEPVVGPTDSPATNDVFIPLSIAYYGARVFSILLFLGSVLLPVASMMNLTDRLNIHLNIQGNVWAGSVFLFIFGLILYGVSWFLKYLRHIKL